VERVRDSAAGRVAVVLRERVGCRLDGVEVVRDPTVVRLQPVDHGVDDRVRLA
jgi:hypothetical protein